MNPGVFSVNHSRIILALTFIILVGGIYAYQNLGRLEDPEFTIKQALIVTPYPGASPEDVAREVTNPIEIACQQMGQVDRIESESTRGRSLVRVHIKDRYQKDTIPQVWDELRRKVNDVQPRLPPSVRGTSQVVDDFGDTECGQRTAARFDERLDLDARRLPFEKAMTANASRTVTFVCGPR